MKNMKNFTWAKEKEAFQRICYLTLLVNSEMQIKILFPTCPIGQNLSILITGKDVESREIL